MRDYFATTPDPDRGFALAILTGGADASRTSSRRRSARPGRWRGSIRCCSAGRYDYVGDLGETIALIWPRRRARRATPPTLGELVETLNDATARRGADAARRAGSTRLDATGRWALVKLVTGRAAHRRLGAARQDRARRDGGKCRRRRSRRSGTALDAALRRAVRLARRQAPSGPTSTRRARFHPMMLAHPLDEDEISASSTPPISRPSGSGTASACSSSARRGKRAIYLAHRRRHRGGVSRRRSRRSISTPCSTASCWCGRDGEAAPFNDLQQRLNRKVVTDEDAGATIRPSCGSTTCCSTAARICARCRLRRAARAARGAGSRRSAAAPRASTCRR